MKTEKEIQDQLEAAYRALDACNKEDPIGMGIWRTTKRYIDALEWVLDEEPTIEVQLLGDTEA